MTRTTEGLKSEALRAALQAALRGSAATAVAHLEQLLLRHSGLPGLRPNLKLAAAVGNELAGAQGDVLALLKRWADDPAAQDTPHAFLPVVAAYGFAQRVRSGLEQAACWDGLRLLAADERSHIRLGALQALLDLTSRETFADQLLVCCATWLEDSDRELSFGATATALEVFGEARVLSHLSDYAVLCSWLDRVFDALLDAPRAAERSAGRRRVLRVLGPTLAQAVATRGAREVVPWFRAVCENATHPELRAVLSQALQALPDLANPPARSFVDELRAVLEGSQKPLRDAARVRPGHGRGRRSRTLR